MSDTKLFFLVTLLLSFAVCASYSLSSYAVTYYNYGEFHFLYRELFAAILGIFIMWGLSYFNVDKYLLTFGLIILSISLFIIIILPFLPDSYATSAGGAKRWLRLPKFSLAPLEFFKIGYIIFVAWSFSRKFKRQDKLSFAEQLYIVIPHLFVFLLIAIIISTLQNDLGQIILLALVLITMLMCAGGRFSLFTIALGIFSILGTILIVISPHRIKRVREWWVNIESIIHSYSPNFTLLGDVADVGGQVQNATYAFYHGGIFGSGLGESVVKLGYLGEVHTDMVLAGISEEAGLLGIVVCTFIFLAMLFRIFKIAFRLRLNFYYLFCVGVVSLLGFSFIINCFGETGIIPIKGMAVPFLSYGGSSLIASCIAIGLVLSLSRKVVMK
ncbi:cell division protein FtsW [Helicobacter saguini]|uniref:Probable peptidoglycan glycosyltransferase FtsW n=1 Tax=Helicobacter saguini TaxID=1548018 RepID=A0A347VN70_9HELI|nr:FtsW/RodA/SpoVE family cell cycle protein [Helicobacter saguini]MWV61879.1 cell division protein FtsW [Helicobacter saguini]MWV67446.1 cell division protein FtsW [Helicobacter saguini]MWV69798.1 cell division protein FtsW [Helicobacter saguini]MWV72984.1 cell division protein FtsW [Helicobacter saguini]TLD95635.1 cell division protein FtsW [Helicobacter saguini]